MSSRQSNSRKELNKAFKVELAIHLYATGILSFGPARRLAGMSKMEFHFLLGQRRIERQDDVDDYEKDLANLEKWEKDDRLPYEKVLKEHGEA